MSCRTSNPALWTALADRLSRTINAIDPLARVAASIPLPIDTVRECIAALRLGVPGRCPVCAWTGGHHAPECTALEAAARQTDADLLLEAAARLADAERERAKWERACGGELPPEGETWPDVARDADGDWHELEAVTEKRIAALEAALRNAPEPLPDNVGPGAALLADAERERNTLRSLLVDADKTARARGDEWGLCDEIDNAGRPYQSQWAANILRALLSAAPATTDASEGGAE